MSVCLSVSASVSVPVPACGKCSLVEATGQSNLPGIRKPPGKSLVLNVSWPLLQEATVFRNARMGDWLVSS